jgi:hypothetical protein
MGDPTQNSNGNFVDHAGVAASTADGKPPAEAGQKVTLKDANGQDKQGTWNGENFVEDKKE